MDRNNLPKHLLEFRKPFSNLFKRLNKLAHQQNKSRNKIILELLNEHLPNPKEDEKHD